jgi:excisionase family DNA binding protein
VATLHRLVDMLTKISNERPRDDDSGRDPELPLLINAVEAGRLLSVSRAKVLGLAARGEIPSVRIGGSVRIPRNLLTAWIGEHAQVEPGTTKRLPNWVRVNRSHEA